MLEDHVVPFIKKWGAGLGLYGEQGGESIHAEFNSLKTTYCRMPSSVSRVYATMKEHYLRVNPAALKLKPKIVHRSTTKRKNHEE